MIMVDMRKKDFWINKLAQDKSREEHLPIIFY